jgi:hypothetical protein
MFLKLEAKNANETNFVAPTGSAPKTVDPLLLSFETLALAS